MKEPRKLSLREEIEREAREIDKEIADHPELEEICVTKEMDATLFAKIRAYEEEKAEDEAARQELREKKDSENVEFSEELVPDLSAVKKTVPYRKKKKRLLLVSLVAVLVLVLGMGMTSVGSKSYWKTLLDKLYGEEPMKFIDVEDMEGKNSEDGDETTAYREIDEKLVISTVRIMYKPKGMRLEKYIIQNDERDVKLFYKYNDEIIQYRIYVNDKDSSLGIKEEDVKIGEYSVTTDKVDIVIEEFQVPDHSICRQVANFEYQGVHYQLKGIMEKEEFEKILKNLFFF